MCEKSVCGALLFVREIHTHTLGSIAYIHIYTAGTPSPSSNGIIRLVDSLNFTVPTIESVKQHAPRSVRLHSESECGTRFFLSSFQYGIIKYCIFRLHIRVWTSAAAAASKRSRGTHHGAEKVENNKNDDGARKTIDTGGGWRTRVQTRVDKLLDTARRGALKSGCGGVICVSRAVCCVCCVMNIECPCDVRVNREYYACDVCSFLR